MGSALDPGQRPSSTARAESPAKTGSARWHFWSARLLVPKLARAILFAVLSSFYVIAFLHILYSPLGTLAVVLSAIYMIPLLALQLFYFSQPSAKLRTPTAYLALLVQACLAYLPMLYFQQAWVAMPGLLAGSVLLVLPPVLAGAVYVAVVASMGVAQAIISGTAIDIAYTTVSTMITGLVVYGLTRLANLVTELHEARIELAEMAVAQERLRFARDLHDLLGYSLSAITLKSELTHRLMSKNPDKAQEELTEILDISRRALADVRSVARGYRELSLDAEAKSARSVLLAADVDVRMDLDYGDLPSRVGTVLATVLREGVTNVLRHSKAECCEITVRKEDGNVRLEIVNDGAGQSITDRRRGGSGIPNLSARVAALGGTLTTGLDPDGRFRLRAVAPLRAGQTAVANTAPSASSS